MVPIVTPRSRRPRPASATAVASKRLADGKVERMIQAAHGHLVDALPQSASRRRENQVDDGQAAAVPSPTRLVDHMDSYPLVPLPVIPQLGIRDLEQVERGLNDLLGALLPHESDQQLGRYAARQLALVQQQLTQLRAQERVVRMLRGDLSVALAPVDGNTLRKSWSAVKLTPRPVLPPDNQKRCLETSSTLPRAEAATQHWKSKKTAVETARAMVQARKTTSSPTTSFVISAGKRRRPRAPAKRTLEEEMKRQTQQLERERENRRRAASQRLQARRELQMKRKQEDKRHKKQDAGEVKDISIGDAGGKDRGDSDSEASDVSNCSESDEANEKAILALDVQVQPSLDEDEDNSRTESDDEETAVGGTDASGCHSSRSVIPVQEPAEQTKKDPEEEITFDVSSFVAARTAAKLEQLHAEKVARDRLTTQLNQLRDVLDTDSDSVSGSVELSSTCCSPCPCGTEEHRDTDKNCDSFPVSLIEISQPCDDKRLETVTVTSKTKINEKKTSWIAEVRESAEHRKATSPERVESGENKLCLPRTPVAECKDYRSYFSNFHCILTAVFEQTRTSSSSSLYRRPVAATGEHTMRLQQKLYESWQSIMQDYATVFGPTIAAPEDMVPLAAAKPWTPHYRINSTARKEVSEIVTNALQRTGGGWEEHPSGLGLKTTWNLLWTWSKPRVERQTLLVWQKVNHFQHAKALTRKDCLKKHIGKYLAAGGRLRQAFDIIPPTFLLPKEYVSFVHAFQERSERLRRTGCSEAKNIWIMKPVALSRGRGISLVNELSQVVYGEQVVIQEYIAAPRLLDGFKFDLRLYVLVTSFNPLEAFLYDEGFVRLCTRPYEDSDLSNVFVHLTNSSIQKDNEEAIAGSTNPLASEQEENTLRMTNEESETHQKDTGGTKTTLAYLWRRLAAEGVDVEQVKHSIEEVVLKALLCGEDQIPFQVNSFDLLGYDILLDADLRPWLIEINSSPSMARDNELDYQVKDAMMLNTLRVVDPLHFDRVKLAEVIARRQRDLVDEKRRPHAHTRHPREAEELIARQLNEDLTAILRGKVPRAYGQEPEHIGNYRRLCPHTTMYNQLLKLKRSYLRVGN